jgi:hypothetical protein
MTRPTVALAIIGVMGIACSLSGVGDTSGASEPTLAAGGGVPISKSTPTTFEQIAPPTEIPPEPTPVSPPTSAPGQERPQFQGSAVLEIVDVTISVGVNELIGIVKNVSDMDIYNLNFDFNFLDASGAIVETKFGSTDLITTPAGSINLFGVFFPADVPANAESVSIDVDWIEGQPSAIWSRDGIRVNSSEGRSDTRAYVVTGEIENITDRRASLVSLLGIAFNSSGRLIGRSFVVIEDLPPRAVAPFSMSFGVDQMPEAVDRYELLTEAHLED